MNVSHWCAVCGTQEDIEGANMAQVELINELWGKNHRHSAAARRTYYELVASNGRSAGDEPDEEFEE